MCVYFTECGPIHELITPKLKSAIQSQFYESQASNEKWDAYYCVFGIKYENQRQLVPWDLGLKIWWADPSTQTNQAKLR